MNRYEYEFAVKCTDKLLENPLCIEFTNPISRNETWSEAYFSIIKKPMDLSTVKSNLEQQYYGNLDEWKQDIFQIWANGKEFNGPRTLLYVICEVLEKKCTKMFSRVPRTENDLIKFKVERINKKIKKLLDMELPENSLAPRAPIETLNQAV